MNCRELLEQIDDIEIKNLFHQLGLQTQWKDPRPSWYRSKIVEYLTDSQVLYQAILPQLETRTYDYLAALVFSGKHPARIPDLERFGLFVNGQMADDIRVMLVEPISGWVCRPRNEPIVNYHPSAFMQFLFVLHAMNDPTKHFLTLKLLMNRLHKFTNDIHDSDLNRYLAYGVKCGLIKQQGNRLALDRIQYEQFTEQPEHRDFEAFYQYWLTDEQYAFIRRLAEFQRDEQQWVDCEKIGIRGNRLLEDIGLLRFIQLPYGSIQISADGWYLCHGTLPNIWTKPSLLVSADLEVLVPHYYHPFIVLQLLKDAKLIKTDFMLSFELPHLPTSLLADVLQTHSFNPIPQVVRTQYAI